MWRAPFVMMLVAAAIAGTGGVAHALQPVSLRCEYQVNPLGIDVMQPRLSWALESNARGAVQTAYQVLVSSSVEKAQADAGDLWDSGKVQSDQSVHVVYNGKALHSGERAWWKVRVWDGQGRVSPYAAPGWWEMGLLQPTDWKAQWIGLPPSSEQEAASRMATPDDLKTIQWIWFPEGSPRTEAPAATRWFRAALDLPAGKTVRKAVLMSVADNHYTAYVNGQEVGAGSGWQSFDPLDITQKLTPGQNLVAIAAKNDGGPAGLAALVVVAFTDGTTQRLATGAAWKTANQQANGWMNRDYNDADWKSALVLANLGEMPWSMPAIAGGGAPGPAPYLLKTFRAARPVRSARLYVSALGLYSVTFNGQRVGNDLLTPGWTDYRKRIPYQTYDVTRSVRVGENALGMVVGDGWYCGYVGFGKRRNHYGEQPHGLAQLVLTYADGSVETVATDDSWKATTGPILTSDLLMGETYDARKEIPGWAETKPEGRSDDARWTPVVVHPLEALVRLSDLQPASGLQTRGGLQTAASRPPLPALVAHVSPTVQRYEELRPRSVTEKPAGSYVFDLGQNMVGWARLKVKGPAGTSVQLRFAEMLNADGSIYTANLRSAKATDTYTLKGAGVEIYEPHFTFHGFRYVEVTGFPGRPDADAITGIVVHSALPETGTFECANPLVNQLQHNIVWGQKGNYLEVPTDCPQRDERLGWMGDAQIFVRTACFNMDVAAFMTKWTQDVVDAQSPEGGFSDVSPRLVDQADGAPAWGDAGIIVPWTIYQCYGDTRLIAERYEAMAKWIEYIRTANPDLLWKNRGNNNFGDWLNIRADTPREVMATAYFAYDAHLMAQMAHAIGKEADAQRYDALFQKIKAAFNAAYVAEDGRIRGDTQTVYVLALRFDLLPPARRAQAAQYLMADIVDKRATHLSTGFVGVGYLLPTLTAIGHLDVAYRLLQNDTFPSWGYSIRQGATTIWERWDGWTTDKGFQTPGMNSFNHYSLGSVGEWMYATVAGIDLDPDKPGYKHILLHPRPGGGIDRAKATYNALYGRIVSDWKQENGLFRYHIAVPANTSATVFIPAVDPSHVTESGVAAQKAAGVRYLRMEDGCAVYEVGSGDYTFAARS